MFGLGKGKRPTFHGYAAATGLRPEWRVQFLVFKSGNPDLKRSSLTGGGQIYGHEYRGTFTPVIVGYSTPVLSQTAGGQIVAQSPFLQGLLGGAASTSAF